MIRRSFNIDAARGRDWEDADDVNPMENIANVSDVMLVLAVGIMLALIMHWNVNISQSVALEETAVEAEDIEQTQGTTGDDDEKYEEVGTVYRDKETGEMYVVG